MDLRIERNGWILQESSDRRDVLKLRSPKKKNRKILSPEQRAVLSRLLAFWRDLYEAYYGLRKVRVDAIDVKVLKSLIEKYEDEGLIKKAMIALFDTCRFDPYYAERRIFPKIPSLSKHWNRFASLALSFDFDVLERFGSWKKVFEALGLVPSVRLKKPWIPFGLDIPETLKNNGLDLSCVFELDGRDAILVDRKGRRKRVRMYAHFCYAEDPVTGKLIDVGDEKIVKVTPHNFEQYFPRWFDKSLAKEDLA